jgi:hypothetical protein
LGSGTAIWFASLFLIAPISMSLLVLQRRNFFPANLVIKLKAPSVISTTILLHGSHKRGLAIVAVVNASGHDGQGIRQKLEDKAFLKLCIIAPVLPVGNRHNR